MALEPKVSGSAIPDVNMGVGLYVVRRLAMAARGAFWIRTGRIVVSASSEAPDVQITEAGAPWQGTAVAVTFRAGILESLMSAMSAIRADLQGHGPRYHEVQMFKRDRDRPGDLWRSLVVAPDGSTMAWERTRARGLAVEQIMPLLEQGLNVSLDFSNTRTATQAFCYALLSSLCKRFGEAVLGRLRLIACSSQVEVVIRLALNDGLREARVPESPDSVAQPQAGHNRMAQRMFR